MCVWQAYEQQLSYAWWSFRWWKNKENQKLADKNMLYIWLTVEYFWNSKLICAMHESRNSWFHPKLNAITFRLTTSGVGCVFGNMFFLSCGKQSIGDTRLFFSQARPEIAGWNANLASIISLEYHKRTNRPINSSLPKAHLTEHFSNHRLSNET